MLKFTLNSNDFVNPEEYREWRKHSDFIKSNILSQSSRIENLMTSQMAIRFSFKENEIDKFHKIFFETNRISFHGIIELYKQYLKEYESEWLNENPDFLEKLGDLKLTRNDFAHGMNPMEDDMEDIEITEAPAVLLHTYKKGELVIVKYSEDEIGKISEDLDRIREVLTLLRSKIAKHKGSIVQGIFEKIMLKNDSSSQDKIQQDSEQ